MAINPLTALVGVVGSALFGKKDKPVQVQPVVQQRPNSEVGDALARRRGSQDNKRSGRGGAEARGGLKTQLGS